MNDRSTINARRPEWPGLSAAELRTEERKVLAVLFLYAALIFFAIVGLKVLDHQGRGRISDVIAAQTQRERAAETGELLHAHA